METSILLTEQKDADSQAGNLPGLLQPGSSLTAMSSTPSQNTGQADLTTGRSDLPAALPGLQGPAQAALDETFRRLRVPDNPPVSPAPKDMTAQIKSIRPYIFAADKVNLDEAARIRDLSAEFKITPHLAAAQWETLENLHMSNRADALPTLREWVANRENAALFKSYAPSISEFFEQCEQFLSVVGFYPTGYDPSLGITPRQFEIGCKIKEIMQREDNPLADYDGVGGLFKSLAAGGVDMGAAALELSGFAADMLKKLVPGDALERTEASLARAAAMSGIERSPIGGVELAGGLREWTDEHLAANFRPGSGMEWLGNLARAVPLYAAQIGLGVATGGTTAAITFMGSQIWGQNYGEYRRAGMSVNEAAAWTALRSVPEMAMEKLGLKPLGLGQTGRLSRAQIAGRIGKTALAEGGTEAAQEAYGQVVDTVALGLHEGKTSAEIGQELQNNWQQIVKDSLYAGSIGVALGGSGGGFVSAFQARQARHILEQEDKVFQAIPPEIKAKLPEAAEGMARAAGMDYVWQMESQAVQALSQNNPDILAPLGLTSEQVAAAVENGQLLQVDAAHALARLSPEQKEQITPLIEALERQEAGGGSSVFELPTPEEQAFEDERIEAIVSEETQDRKALDAELDRLEQELAASVQDTEGLRRQAAGAGGVRGMNKNLLEVWKRWALNLARTSGEKPAEILRRIRVQSGKQLLEEARRQQAALLNMPLEERNPLLAQVRGRLDAASLKETWPDAYKEIRAAHGLNLFRKKEKGGLPIDELANELVNMGLLPHDAGADELVEILKEAPARLSVREPDLEELLGNDLLLAAMNMSQAQPLVREGITRKPDSATANVVEIEPDAVPQFNGMGELADWLKGMLTEGGDITIKATGQVVRFTNTGINASLKRGRSQEHRNAYAGLRDMVANAEYNHYEPKDARHPNSGGQDVYHAALRMGSALYSVRMKFDVPNEQEIASRRKYGEKNIEDARYKDHRLTEIEIAPALYRGVPGEPASTQAADAISRITLGVLRGNVKPSNIEDNTLYQSAWHGSPHRFDEFSLEHIGSGEGAQAHGWGLYFAGDKKVAEGYRHRLTREEPKLVYKDMTSRAWETENYDPENPEHIAAITLFNELRRDEAGAESAERYHEILLEQYEQRYDREGREIYEGLRALDLTQFDFEYDKGQLFEVDIPESDVLLDEDLLLNEQPLPVREAIMAYYNSRPDDYIAATSPDNLGYDTGKDFYKDVVFQMRREGADNPNRAASELLNSLGIKGITYDGRQDGRCYVVFDDKAIQVLDTYYQSQKAAQPIEVNGDELGVPEGADIREYRKAARKVYRQLQSSPAYRADLGEIKFTRAGWKEAEHTGADPRKWKLFPKLKELVENAEYIQRADLNKDRKDNIIAFHWLEADVILNGEHLRIGINVAEDADGNKFYNINQDLAGWLEKEEALAGHRRIKHGPQTELLQDVNTSVKETIEQAGDNVNLHILSEATSGSQGAAGPVMRGGLSISQDNQYIITLFKDADLSTLLHETGHIFLEEMERIIDLELANTTVLEDYAALKEWFGRFDDPAVLKAEYDARLKGLPRFGSKTFEALDDAERKEARRIAEKEYFARGFEAYLLEGKAPSSKLLGAFQRFRKWLLRIYGQAAKALGVELNPQVRAVFDRLLATELEVNYAAAVDNVFTLTDQMAEALKLTPEETAERRAALERAKNEALDLVVARRSEDRTERIKAWTQEAEAALAKNPAYATLSRIRAKDGQNRIDPQLVKDQFGEDFFKQLLARLGPGVFKAGGKDPDAVALENGWANAGLMFASFLKLPSKKEAIANHIQGREADFEARTDPQQVLLETMEAAAHAAALGELTARAALEAEAARTAKAREEGKEETLAAAKEQADARLEAEKEKGREILEDARKQAAAELSAAKEEARKQAKEAKEKAKTAAGAIPAFARQAFKEGALRRFKSMPMADALMSGRFLRNLELAGRRWARLLAAGKYAEALDANTAYRLNLEFYRLSLLEKRSFERAIARSKSFIQAGKPSKYSAAARYAVNLMADRFGLIPLSKQLAESKNLDTILAWEKERQEAGYPLEIDRQWLTGPAQNWRELSVEQVRDLLEEMQAIAGIEKDRTRIMLDGKKVEADEAAHELTENIYKYHKAREPSLLNKDPLTERTLKQLDAVHTKQEFRCLRLDGGEMLGICQRLLYAPMAQATQKYNIMFKGLKEKLDAAFSVYGGGRNRFGVPLSRVTNIEGNITREQLEQALAELAGKDLPNRVEDLTAQVNANQKRKIMSAKAREKSIANGFSFAEHTGVAAQIAHAWNWAAEAGIYPDKDGNTNVEIVRYVSPLSINGKDAFAWITVKKSSEGNRIYSVELMDEKKLRGSLGTRSEISEPNTPSSRSFEEIISRLNKPVKDAAFSTDDLQAKANKLLRPVASIKRNVIQKSKGISAIQAAKNWIAAHVKKPVQTTAGLVHVEPNGIQDSLSHSMYQNKLDAVQAIVPVLKNGVYLGQQKDWSGKPIDNHYFAGKVDFDGEEKIVFVRTRQAEGRQNRFYVHEVFTEDEIKKAGAMQTGAVLADRVPGNAPDFYRSLIAEVLKVKSEVRPAAPSPEELDKIFSQKLMVIGFDEPISKGQAIMAALNMGNEGNLERLKKGHGWNDMQVNMLAHSLDARDWQFVQSIWGIFESYKEEAFALEERLTGRRPKSVEPKPFMTRFGRMEGGYFPIVYDPKHAAPELQERINSGNRSIHSLTQKGHLQDRSAGGAGTPLLLELGTIPRQLDNLITDISFREPAVQVFKMMKRADVRKAIESTLGQAHYQAMISWLKDSVKENKPLSALDSFARWGRIGATTVAMGMKATTIVQQPLGLAQSISFIGLKGLRHGFAAVYGGGVKQARERMAWIREVSPFMDNRLGNYDRDVKDLFNQLGDVNLDPQGVIDEGLRRLGVRGAVNAVRNVAFKPIAGVQYYAVDVITWMGAYEKALNEPGGDAVKACAYADSVVRMSQGSGDTIDLASIQRGGELAKCLTMFYSFFNVLYNLAAMRASDVYINRNREAVTRAARDFLLFIIVPAVLGEFMAGRGWEGDEDDDSLSVWTVKSIASYTAGVSPLTRWIPSGLAGYGGDLTSAARGAGSFLQTVNQALRLAQGDEKADLKKLSRAALLTGGHALGLPAGQAEITLFNLWDYIDGASPDFELRDLFFRRQESRR